MFRRLPDIAQSRRTVALTVDGAPVTALEGDTVAAALLAAGHCDFRTTPVIGSRRGPFCMMGVCFDCLLVIDGVANQQSCMIPVRDAMRVERQQGAREPGR